MNRKVPGVRIPPSPPAFLTIQSVGDALWRPACNGRTPCTIRKIVHNEGSVATWKQILTLAAIATSATANSETVDVDSEGHYVPLNEVEWIDLENGYEAYPGYRRHIAAIGKDGKTESHWCTGTNAREKSGSEPGFDYAAGYCVIVETRLAT